MKPRVHGAVLGLALVCCLTGCDAGVFGEAAGGGSSSGGSPTVTVTASGPSVKLKIRVHGTHPLKPTWSPFINTALTHVHSSGTRVLLALETMHQPFGARVVLVSNPHRGGRYGLTASVRNSRNLTGRLVVLQLSVRDQSGSLINFATVTRRLSSGWRPLSVHGRIPIAGGSDLRVAIYVDDPVRPPAWLEIRRVVAVGISPKTDR